MRNDMISFRVQQILNMPIVQRCQELTIVCVEVDFKQLKECFPVILENIFGAPGWGLRVSDRSTLTLEKDSVLKFLDPMGPLFSLAYKLCSDFYLRYELPLTLLPPKLKRDLEKGVLLSSWYCERIFMDPQTRRATALKLSPFELLMFRFSLHLLPQLQPDVWIESIYLQLLERYLCHFLPCQMQSGPVEPHVPYTPPSPQTISPHFAHSSPMVQGQRISLLKPASAFSPVNSSASMLNQHNPLAEIWRTVHIINILVDVWLSFDDEKGGISPNSVRTSPQPTLPSAEHARMVRAFLKHIHYFANSACYTNPSDMDEMKKMVIPMYRSKIYHFLSGCIKNWPYDQSFRIIMEAWLSYIQPWRYTSFSNYGMRENDESGKPVDRRWQIFIAENLPFYGCIFDRILNRFSKIDLSILKNAIMLHRVCRFLTLENLKPIISEVEESLRLKGAVPVMSPFNSRVDVTENTVNVKIQAAAQTAVAELEGQLYVYKPTFGYDTVKQTRDFLRELFVARQRAETLLEEQKKKPKSNGFWSALLCLDDEHNEEYTVDDRRRVVDILKNCYSQICTIFDIQDMDVDGGVSDVLNRTFLSESSLHNSTFITSQREVVIPKPGGDPDKRPICSYEIAWLVRMFHDIASYFNREYHFEIQALHTREDMWGRIARQVLEPPTSIGVYERNRDGYKARTEKTLPARLSLRKLAHKRVVFWLAVFCFSAKMFGFHYIVGLLVPFIIFCGITFVNALRE